MVYLRGTGTNDKINPLQIRQDIFTSVVRALSQLGVLDMPDLVCVSMDSDWKSIFGLQGNLLLSDVTGELGVASKRLRRFRLPSLDFDIEQESVGVAATKQIFEAAANVTVYQSVFAFLLEGTKFAWNWAEDQTITFGELLDVKVLKSVIDNMDEEVLFVSSTSGHQRLLLE